MGGRGWGGGRFFGGIREEWRDGWAGGGWRLLTFFLQGSSSEEKEEEELPPLVLWRVPEEGRRPFMCMSSPSGLELEGSTKERFTKNDILGGTGVFQGGGGSGGVGLFARGIWGEGGEGLGEGGGGLGGARLFEGDGGGRVSVSRRQMPVLPEGK